MIAIFRIRFDTNLNTASVWSDTLFDNWMNPAIPFSLGNFWWESSWGHYDVEVFWIRPDGMVFTNARDPHLNNGNWNNPIPIASNPGSAVIRNI